MSSVKPDLAPLSYVSYAGSYPSRRVIQAARDALCAALTHAVSEEEIGKNGASLVTVPKPRRRRIKPWSAAEAGQFLADGAARQDRLFAAWVQDSHGVVFTTKYGTPIEPGDFTRMFPRLVGPASAPSRCGTPGTRAARSWSPFGCTRKWHSESCGTRRSR